MKKLIKVAVIFLLAGNAAAMDAELTVQEPAGVARKGGLVTCGVPFAQGAVKSTGELTLQSEGKALPVQFSPLAKWSDGSVRWALMDCQLDVAAGGNAKVTVRADGQPAQPASPVKVQDGQNEIVVSTGPLSFAVGKSEFNLFRSIKVDGVEMLTPGGRGLVLYSEGGKEILAGVPSNVVVEAAGPMRAVVCVKGVFPDVHKGLLSYTARITAYAGSKMLKVRVWVENNGAHGFKASKEWFFFKGFAVELGLDGAQTAELVCDGAKATGKMRVSQMTFGGAKTISDGKELAKAARTDGVVSIGTPKCKLIAAVRDFWQNYDQAIEFDSGTLRFWFWPTDGQWPRKGCDLGGWSWARKDGLTALPGGVHKGHEFVLDFSGRPAAETSAELCSPLAAVNPVYFASTEAANILFAPASAGTADDELNWKLKFRDNMAGNLVDAKSRTSLLHARTTGGDWYGWMHFGDVNSASGGYYAGWMQTRNLHYDWTWSVLLHYMRTGNAKFLGLGTEMARHLEEIDQNWSDRDAAPYRALFRGDGSQGDIHTSWDDANSMGQPQPSRNWLGGIVLYYMLTGDPKALECAERNYKGMVEARVKSGDYWKRDPENTIQATLLTINNLLSLHALSGDQKYINDIKAVIPEVMAWRKEFGPHLYDPGRENSGQGFLMLGQQLCFGIEALCEYHYRTKDPAVESLLKDAAAKGSPDSFYDAGLYFSDLYAYLGWTSGDAKLLDKGMRAFADGFPESETPAIYFEGRKDWTVRPPMMLRAGTLMQFVCWKNETAKR